MPSMKEIYASRAIEYDELVECEDYRGNMNRTLHGLFDFKDKTVVEFGTGTGRLTQMYIAEAKNAFCLDRSAHMLETAYKKLCLYNNKITYLVRDNMDPGRISAGEKEIADFVVEGWSFGHSIAESTRDMDTTARKLVENCESLCRSGGVIVLIETLGSNSAAPNPPGEKLRRFYEALEAKHGFSKTVIATDYKFSSAGEAHRIFTYFFGEETGRSIKEKGSPIVPEFTGIWHKTVT